MRMLSITAPKPYRVFQRQRFCPAQSHVNASGGAQLGYADVPVTCRLESGTDADSLWIRLVPLAGMPGTATPWARHVLSGYAGFCRIVVRGPAGGWYRLEVQLRRGAVLKESAWGGPVGIGEVFLIAGQSYAEGCNDEHMRVEDPAGRITAMDIRDGSWRIAHDPAPNLATGGTIWPPMANALLPVLRVPIGFVNVAVAATSSHRWLPGGALFNRLLRAARMAGRFRCVLWQQGESDVLECTSAATYVRNLLTLQAALSKACGTQIPWLLAKSTFHPTVYCNPIQEGVIRSAIEQLWRLPQFFPGPDTDVLGDENRGSVGSRQHFSGIGQRRAGLMWFASILNFLNREPQD